MRSRAFFLTLALVLLGSTAASGASVSHSFGMTGWVTAEASSDDCSNSPGPSIRLSGAISLGQLEARLRFSNNLRGTHQREEDVITSITLTSEEPIEFAKQPSLGGVGGNPHVWLQLHDATGAMLADVIYLGRCVQGFNLVDVDVLLPALVSAEVAGSECRNSPGPFITIDGGLSLGGVYGTLVFTNNAQFTHVHEEDVTVGLALVPEGESITFPKQPPQGGVGGNPHIFLQFLSGGEPVGDEIYLGRCSEL